MTQLRPFGLDTIYLFSDDSERFPGTEIKYLKEPIQQSFKGQPGAVSITLGSKLDKIFLQLPKRLRPTWAGRFIIMRGLNDHEE